MLSIEPLKTAQGAADYYCNVVNYYHNDSKSIRWLGEGANALGLHGKSVEKETMLALLQGKLPDGTQLGRIDKEGVHHRPGFDMTVSAPKSFSILLESGADPRLAEVLDEAVEWFVSEMEQEFAQVRIMRDGNIDYVDTGNFVVAAFRQPNSRANDPQSHIHLVTMNMSQCPDKKWRSLASDMQAERGVVEQIMKHHIYGGLKFRNKLASLTCNLGYTIESTGDGFWEIKGVPKEISAHFSKRRESIEQYMNEKGMAGARAASIATQRTRMAKAIVDFGAWKEEILTTCKTLGFDALGLVAGLSEPKNLFARVKDAVISRFFDQEKWQMMKGEEAVHVAIESVSQQKAVFSPRNLKEQALKHSIASEWVVDERHIDRAIEKKVAEQALYRALHPVTQKTMLTTPWQLQLESETIARIEKGKGDITPLCTVSKVNAFIKEKEEELSFKLSASQKRAMIGFLTSSDRFMAIQGYAGTGKTTMLKLTASLAESLGYELRGITAGSSAAGELQKKGGITATTFARELVKLQQQKADLSRIIFVVDEASMLSNPQGHKIIELIEEAGSQLKIIGDRAQLPSPSSGRFFSLIQDYGTDTVHMTDNLRQKEGMLRESALHASRGEIYDAVEKLTEVKMRDTYSARIEETANTWLSLSKEEREQTLLFAPTHKNRADITELLRKKLKEEGTLQGELINQTILTNRPITSIELRQSIYYSAGDVLRFNTAIPRFNIRTGDYLTVQPLSSKHKQSKSLCLLRDNGRKITFPLSALPKFNESNKDLERPIEIYREGCIELQAGDRIQWKRNHGAKGIHNSELATIETITCDEITIKHQDNHLVCLKRRDPALKHLDHGYVLTTYGAQGKDRKRGIGLIESSNRFSTTIENYYVETTRGIDEMIVITDDKDNLVKTVTTRDSQKEASLDFIDCALLEKHQASHANAELPLATVIEKKSLREAQWKTMEGEIAAYNEAKEQGKSRNAAIHALKIVTNPTCLRLAQARLSYGYRAYRQDAFALQNAKLSKQLTGDERRHFNAVKQYVFLSSKIAGAVRHINEQAETKNDKAANQKKLQSHYVRLYQAAAGIVADMENHRPWLHHFSIGEVNRLGIPQHHLRKENEKAYARLEKLAKHATLHQIRQSVDEYTEADKTQKPRLALKLKRDAKLAHRFIVESAHATGQSPDALWKAIHTDARSHRDTLFRQGLSLKAKAVFDEVKTYQALQQEISQSWHKDLKLAQKGGHPLQDPETQALFALKNKLADQLIANPALHEVMAWFKLDGAALKKQSTQYHYRETVQAFLKPTADFSKKLALAALIKDNIKGHYPYLLQAEADLSRLNKMLKCVERKAHCQQFEADKAADYKLLLQYKMAAYQAKAHWKSHFTSSKHGLHREQAQKALRQTARKEAIAARLQNSAHRQSLLSLERIDEVKFKSQADSHQEKCQQIHATTGLADKLIQQFPSLESQTSKAISAWKNNWAAVVTELTRFKQDAAFSEAIKGREGALERVSHFDEGLKQSYNLAELSRGTTTLNPALQKLSQSRPLLDARMVNDALMAHPEATYKAIFGEPKTSNAREMRYSGGLIVTLKGSKEGLWYDFTEAKGGLPIDAIMHSRQIDFKEALKIASDLAGLAAGDLAAAPIHRFARESTRINKETIRQNSQLSAKSIWEGGIPIKGTLAETYLSQHRGIKQTDTLKVRFWPIGTPWINCREDGVLEEKTNQVPALIIPATNSNNQLTGVQRIYLDKITGGKNRLMDNPKLSKGTLEGSAAILHVGMKGAPVFIAEGVETAASIAVAFPSATVMAALGLANMKNLTPLLEKFQGREVVIAADFDGEKAKTAVIIEAIADDLRKKEINVRVVYPEPLKELKKTDWNDVLLKKGIQDVQNQLTDPALKESIKLIEKSFDATAINNKTQRDLTDYNRNHSNQIKRMNEQKSMELEI